MRRSALVLVRRPAVHQLCEIKICGGIALIGRDPKRSCHLPFLDADLFLITDFINLRL